MSVALAQLKALASYQAQYKETLSRFYRTMSTTRSTAEIAILNRQHHRQVALKMVIGHLRFVLTDTYPASDALVITRVIQRVRENVAKFPALQQQKLAEDVDTLLRLLAESNCQLLPTLWPLDIAEWK